MSALLMPGDGWSGVTPADKDRAAGRLARRLFG